MYEWIGEIKDGQIPVNVSKNVRDQLHFIKNGTVRLFVDKYRETRSNRQNRMYWGLYVQTLADETGYTKDEIHDILRYKFLGYRETKLKNGEVITTLKSTQSLNTREFTLYLDDVYKWAHELGIQLEEIV